MKVGGNKPSVHNNESTKKIWFIHTVDYSVILRKAVLVHATTWMNFEDIILRVIKPDIKGQILYDFTYMEYLG